jgi:aldehyde dehydrogenase (NAD+)
MMFIPNYATRKQHLLTLKKALQANEENIYKALYTDLKKNKEEAFVTEFGFAMAELRHTLRNLKQWMRKKAVPTNLMNLPSSSYTIPQPVGTALVIGPWNYPLQLTITPLIGALAAGNKVILKPSEHAPATAHVIQKIISENFETDHIQVLLGDGQQVIPTLINSTTINHIFFTGSTAVGKKIYQLAAEKLIPVTLELGGKSPCIVSPSANLKGAAKRIAVSKFSNCGQMCVAPDYLLVHKSIKEKFIDQLQNTITQFFGTDPQQNENYGKIINENHFKRLTKLLVNNKPIFGGEAKPENLYIQPTLVNEPAADSELMQQEIFGPILPIITYQTNEEALAVINKNPNPLAFYYYGTSKTDETYFINQVPFGGGCINNSAFHLTNYNLPFGGLGNSGIGSYHGYKSFEIFSHFKSVLKTPSWFFPPLLFPPFKGKLKWYKKLI